MGSVIKVGQQNPSLFRRLEATSISDHLGEAKVVVEKSRDKARSLLSDAQREADEIRRKAESEGYEAGFRRGYQAGTEAGRKEAIEKSQSRFKKEQAGLIKALQATLTEYAAAKQDLFVEARNDVLEFAIAVARRATMRIGELDRTVVAVNLDAALELVEKRTNLILRVSPLDITCAKDHCAQLAKDLADCPKMDVVEDPGIAPGGCRIEYAGGAVDSTLETQVDQIVEALVGTRKDGVE